MATSLPIDALLPELVEKIRRHGNIVLRAPTGAGKTTRVPPALLDAGLAPNGKIVMLEPRRLAARAATYRMTQERGGKVGEEIGYHVRFDRRWGHQTRILVVTEGILLRMLQDDPFLEKVDLVIFDEFHERSLDADLALGMVRLIQQTVRPNLPILVMSATLELTHLQHYLGNCPVLTSEGRQHPVEIMYEPRSMQDPWPLAAAKATEKLLARTSGDLLVFLPGLQEIHQTAHHLEKTAQNQDFLIMPLHGDLPPEKQDAALLPQARRKVVLATNVAETSVTVEGITGVVDTGLARLMNFDPRLGLDRLQLTPISQASADQRTGRAGRTGPGVCIRLWSEAAHRLKPVQTEPEIRRVDLAGAVLHLLYLGETDLAKFPWLEPPQSSAIEQALVLLGRLGAVDGKGLTDLGKVLARLPVHPRLARLLVEGQYLGQSEKAALAAALLADRDPFRSAIPGTDRGDKRSFHSIFRAGSSSDILDRVEALENFEKTGQCHFSFGELHRGAVRFVLRARDQLLRSLRQETKSEERRVERGEKNPGAKQSSPHPPEDEGLLRALLVAFPDRLIRRREPGSRRGLMVGGRGVRLAPISGVTEAELFLGIDVDAGRTETLVRQASMVERQWLPEDLVKAAIEVEFDPAAEKVIARRRLYFLDLLLEETSAAFPDENQVAQVLAEAARQNLARVLPPPDSPAGSYLLRFHCLRQWMPELHLPALNEAELGELLPWLSPGCRSFADLRQANWLAAIQGRLTQAQKHAIEREAPERLQVPSGNRLALRYEQGKPPVLAVRIQEIFGWQDTPRLAGGRVPILLHLLAPNFRPQQVTDDLASFWTNTYPLIRKELRARYPKHAWPEDPRTATAQSRPAKRTNQGKKH